MAYTSLSEIARREALLKALAGNQMQVDPRGPVSWTQGLAQVLGSYGARKGQEQLTEMENENQRLQSEDVNNLIRALQSGGMNEKSVTGGIYNGGKVIGTENIGTIPRKNYSFQTPEVGNMYAQALMNQELNKQDKLLSPEEFNQQMALKNAGQNTGEFGLTPNLYQKDGKWFERIYNKAGQFTDREMPGEPVRGMPFNAGMQGEISGAKQQGQKDVDLTMNPQIAAAEKTAELTAETGFNAQRDLPKLEAEAQYTIELLDKAINHPGRAIQTGMSSYVVPKKGIAGTSGADFASVMEQIGGKQFLQAFETLKGGGQITQIEGEKATAAMARLSTSQTEEEFVAALEELKSIVGAGLERARQKSSQYRTMTPLVNEPAGVPDEGDALIQKYLQGL